MLRYLALVLAFAGLLPASALAHGPTRQKVTTKIEINAPVEKVWAVIGNFQDMSWHPQVASTEGTGGNEPNAARKVTLKSGGTTEDKLNKYGKEDRAYSYEITAVDVKVLPVTNLSGTITAQGTAEKTIVEWRAAFYRGYVNNDPPPELSDEAAVKAITDFITVGLAGLKGKLEAGG